MSTPLTASWRITIPYTVSGKAHKHRAYVRIATITPTYTLRQRDGTTTMLASLAIDILANKLAIVVPAGSVFGTALLEEYSGGLWLPRYSHAPTMGTVISGTLAPASQITVVLRDTGFHKIRAIMLDTKFPPPGHWNDDGTAAGLGGWTDRYGLAGASSNDPYYWQVSRGNLYLQDSPWAGITFDLNNKVRRARGLT